MKTYTRALAILSLVTTISAQTQDLNRLAWMTGAWAGVQDGTQMEEYWMAAKGNSMLGLHRDVVGDKTASFEFLRIVRTQEGISYIAQPQGGAATAFRLVESSQNRAVFENKAHDFPQRIIYWSEKDILHARIEGQLDGKLQSMEWSWRRVR